VDGVTWSLHTRNAEVGSWLLAAGLNPVWHRMLYSCTHMATVSVEGLTMWFALCQMFLFRLDIQCLYTSSVCLRCLEGFYTCRHVFVFFWVFRLQCQFVDIPSSMMINPSSRFHGDQIALAMHHLIVMMKQRPMMSSLPWTTVANAVKPDIRLVWFLAFKQSFLLPY